jgi:hypothetical protein
MRNVPLGTGLIIEKFKAVSRNSLRGFARVRMPSGMIFHDVTVHEKEGARWASPASKPVIGRDGTNVTRDGKLAYQSVVSFATKEARDKFSAAVVAAIEDTHPGAFE